MAFWGCVLKPGSKVKVEDPEGDILHLSQACLHDPKDGKNYIQAVVGGQTYSLACLEKGKKEHDSFDLFFNPSECFFATSGKSEVHLTGYFEPDEGDEDGESEAEAVPQRSPTPKTSPKAAAQAPPKSPAKVAEVKAVTPKASPKASPKAAPAAPAKSPAKSPAAPPADSDDDDEDLLEEGEEEEMLEESESEEAPPPSKAKAGDKRKAPEPVAASPAKKAAVSPATKGSPKPAAGGSPAKPPAGGELAAYVKKLHDYLKQQGKTSVSLLGSKVPRPKDAPKLKAVFEANKDKFVVSGQDVSAK